MITNWQCLVLSMLEYEKEIVRRVSFVYLRMSVLLRVFGLMFAFSLFWHEGKVSAFSYLLEEI